MRDFARRLALRIALCIVTVMWSCTGPQTERMRIAEEMQSFLEDQMLRKWYPLVVDSLHGGYLSDFNYRWEPDGPQNKMIVTQARHVWTTSRAAEFTEEEATYVPIADHGAQFLRTEMWDQQYSGFYNQVTREGTVIAGDEGEIIKRAYGNAFAIYGLAAYYRVSGNEQALQLAKEAFRWLDEHSHDPEYGGYFQFMARDGTPFTSGYQGTPPKDQNSSIHLLEAFTELYQVWKDDVLRERLQEMLFLIRDTMVHPRGYLRLFFRRDLTPVSYRDFPAAVREEHYNLDHVSFGHDVETAYLMLEASHVLGFENDTTTLRIAKQMVDHSLRTGWHTDVGGFYDMGYYLPGQDTLTILEDTKNWWAQAEGLNSLLLMANLFPDDPVRYFDKFRTQWKYVDRYLLDHEYGGWYAGGIDKQPEMKNADKSHIWKGAYHTTRSLVNCIQRLRENIEEPVE